jgi:para-aminobenzoate synthetase / 4-amino-4-deoxychorismate lyase
MLLDNGDYFLLDRHLLRLQSSARYFDFAINMDKIHHTLKSNAANLRDGLWRVRLLLSEHGDVRLENFPIIDKQDVILACLAGKPISRFNRFLYHKTTNRNVYDDVTYGKIGFDDVLLWNEDDELTEFTKGNIVVEIDGQRFTPPVESGLLAGTFRSDLLDANQITERVLKKSEIDIFSRVWLINSVRKFVPVHLQREG